MSVHWTRGGQRAVRSPGNDLRPRDTSLARTRARCGRIDAADAHAQEQRHTDGDGFLARVAPARVRCVLIPRCVSPMPCHLLRCACVALLPRPPLCALRMPARARGGKSSQYQRGNYRRHHRRVRAAFARMCMRVSVRAAPFPPSSFVLTPSPHHCVRCACSARARGGTGGRHRRRAAASGGGRRGVCAFSVVCGVRGGPR